MQMLDKAKNFLTDAGIYWKTPMKGKYINYRSIFAYSVGGIGVYAIIFLYTTISVSSTNVIITNLTGLDPTQLLMMYYFTFFVSIFFTGFRAKVIDNARSKKGKYRPYILSMGIPTAVLCCAVVWMPYEQVPVLLAKIMGEGAAGLDTAVSAVNWVIAFLLNLGLQFCYGFFYDAYDNLILVMSPNTQERSDVASVKSVVYSFAPTVLNPLLPLIQKWLNADDIYDVRIYKIMFPITALIGLALTVLVYAYTEEKIVQAKTHITEIHFTDAMRAVAKNKYFWIISLAGWLGFLESSYNYILTWLYNYAGMCSEDQYAVITVIYGNASLWGMLAAPFAIRKWGKKKVLIVTNAFNILFIALLYPAIGVAHSIWLVLACLYMNALVGSFAHILNPSLNADIRDYQQYITGERIDGMFAAVGLIGSFISLATGSVLPTIFKSYGIHSGNGYENMYDILKYEPDTMYSLVYLLIFLAVIGAAFNVIPYFFYDLSELKQTGMVRILKIRALFEDYGNNALKDADLIEAVDLVNEAKKYASATPVPLSKAGIKAAKAAKNKEAVKAARAQYKQDKKLNEEIEIAKIVVSELNKFSTRRTQMRLTNAKKVYAYGRQYALNLPGDLLKQAKGLPKNTKEEKQIRQDAIEDAKIAVTAAKCAQKHFINGIPAFDYTVLTGLFDESDEIDDRIRRLYRQISDLKKQKNTQTLAILKDDLKHAKEQKKANDRAIKNQTDKAALYNRAVKPYENARRMVNQERDYDCFDEIQALYGDAVKRETARMEAENQKKKALEEARKAEKEARIRGK